MFPIKNPLILWLYSDWIYQRHNNNISNKNLEALKHLLKQKLLMLLIVEVEMKDSLKVERAKSLTKNPHHYQNVFEINYKNTNVTQIKIINNSSNIAKPYLLWKNFWLRILKYLKWLKILWISHFALNFRLIEILKKPYRNLKNLLKENFKKNPQCTRMQWVNWLILQIKFRNVKNTVKLEAN